MKRVIFDCLAILCLFLMPWWVVGIIALLGLFYFKSFYEFILIGFSIVSIYKPISGSYLSSYIYLYTFIIISYILIQIIRNYIILYKDEISY